MLRSKKNESYDEKKEFRILIENQNSDWLDFWFIHFQP